MITWANNWNGVNHPATAPADEEPQKLGAEAVLKRLDLVAELVRVSRPSTSEIFNSPPAEFQPDGGWETAR